MSGKLINLRKEKYKRRLDKVNKNELQKRIDGLNEFMLSNSTKKLLLLRISSDYTYNKAIAIVDKEYKNNDWYATDDKNCFRTWDEVEAFIDGICRGKNTDFGIAERER